MKRYLWIGLWLLVLLCCGCQKEEPVAEETQVSAAYGETLPVSRALAARMLALSLANEEEIRAMDHQISFADVGKDDWFYPYVNYVCAKGYLQGTEEGFLPEAPLTGGQAAVLLSYMGDFEKSGLKGEEDPISLALWISFWQEALEGMEESEGFSTISVGILQTAEQGGLSPWYAATTDGTFCHAGYSLDAYVGKTMEVVVKDDQMVAIKKEVEDGYRAEGIYCRFSEGKVEICSGNGGQALDWAKGAEDGIYDVVVEKGNVVQLEDLEGEEKTVQRLQGETVFFTDGTKATLAPKARIWEKGGTEKGQLFCGAKATVYWRGEQVAAFLLSGEGEERVEMVLRGENGLVWPAVTVKAEGGLRVNGGETDQWQTPTEEEKTTIEPKEGEKLEVTVGEDTWQVPKVTVWKEAEGYVIVASLSEEDYLSGVLAGQILEETEEEAAKAQAVVARSQLWTQKRGDTYLAYGAQVDSSSWNEETEMSRRAVEETKGLLLWNGDEVWSGTFFSVSCGSFAAKEETWPVNGVFLGEEKEALFAHNDAGANLSLTEEMTAFLKSAPESADSQSSWYRWESERSWGALTEGINGRLAQLSAQAPLLVKVRQENGQFLSVPVGQVGDVTNLVVSRRGMGGNVMEVIVYGTEEIVLLRGADVICQAFGAGDVVTMDGEVHWQGNLPSPFFVLEETEGGLCILGGGYGHGVGMSQAGANQKAKTGATFEEILAYYYPTSSVGEWGQTVAEEEKS